MIIIRGLNFENVLNIFHSNSMSHFLPKTTLVCKNDVRKTSFTDVKKNHVVMYGNMIETCNRGPMPYSTTKPCWNCRHPFNSRPLGIPLRYVKLSKADEEKFKQFLIDHNFSSDTSGDGYFEVEGIVCSWECMKNFICERSCESRYKDSANLMALMYTMFTSMPLNIQRAGTWRALKEWGGHQTIDEFRESFQNVVFVDTINFKRPMMYTTSRMYEEKIVI